MSTPLYPDIYQLFNKFGNMLVVFYNKNFLFKHLSIRYLKKTSPLHHTVQGRRIFYTV